MSNTDSIAVSRISHLLTSLHLSSRSHWGYRRADTDKIAVFMTTIKTNKQAQPQRQRVTERTPKEPKEAGMDKLSSTKQSKAKLSKAQCVRAEHVSTEVHKSADAD